MNTLGAFLQLKGDSGQEKKLRNPERALCSPGMPENVSPCWTQAHTPTTISTVAAAAMGGVALVPSEGYLFLCGQIRVGVGGGSPPFLRGSNDDFCLL